MLRSAAMNTVIKFMGINAGRVKTFNGLKKRLNVKPDMDIKPDNTQWTIKDLIKHANIGLDALDACHHTTKRHINLWGKDYGDQSDWANLRLEGPYIPHSVEAGSYKNIEVFGSLPYAGIIGMARETGRDKEEMNYYDFIMFQRLDSLPRDYIPTGPGYPYIVNFVVMYKEGPVKMQWCCTIDNDGVIHTPKVTYYFSQIVRDKHGERFIPRQSIRLYDPITEMRKRQMNDEKRAFEHGKFLTSAQVLAWAIDIQSRIDMNVTVRISDHRGVLNISIPMEDAKRLFRHRIKAKTSSGRTKPIFHWVRSHTRITGSNVKTHWRGLRKFTWSGMFVEIYIPGVHQGLRRDSQSVVDSGLGWFARITKKSVDINNPATGEVFEVTPVDDKMLNSVYYNDQSGNIH